MSTPNQPAFPAESAGSAAANLSQVTIAVGLGIQPHELDQTVYNAIMERSVSATDVLMKTRVDGVDLLPSNIDLSAAEVQLVAEVGREHTLLRVLRPVMNDYDYVL